MRYLSRPGQTQFWLCWVCWIPDLFLCLNSLSAGL